ncbi:hypothetical protein BJ875DRAFT_370792 [Amylocarpus encephaloides]|uniref:Ribosomal protein s17 n=1 Tax=Amylocarpus encephaloides TaxID=45428 RepID=A0A9P7YNH4_9HELO|nr:hypothetical protein BJ875DRAFT_370792 [Amylocarpus encephaloides]
MVDARVPRHLGLHRRQNDDATSTTLAADAVQSGSFTDGSVNGDSAAGQAKSLTSQNNFINNCAGKTLTNGLQVQEGSCNGITMGDIPAKANMVSAVITFPTTGGDNVEADTSFDIEVQINNLVAGSFTNAASTYYTAPQALQGGKIIGHTHVTVQDLGNSLNPKQALDATQFAFFKGINDAGNGQGLLKATVTGGLPAGNYRVCTMTAASNHQPVLMPVAQRGTPDDCTKFVVGAAAGNGSVASSAAGGASASATQATNGNGNGDGTAASSAVESAATSAAAGDESAASSTSSEASAATSAAANAGDSAATSSAATASATEAATGSANTGGAVGGVAAPAVDDSGDAARPFSVNGNTFVNKAAAVQRSCDIQFNACADAFNNNKQAGVTMEACSAQQTTCNAQ